jgi:DivIVA domain-containing protein
MKLTPLDIRRSEFSRSMRGYNREEVESFLTIVADEVEGLIGEHRELTRRVEELQKQIDEYRDLERTLTETLIAAQKSADDLRESSLRDVELTRREAQVRADQLYDTTRIEAERLMLDTQRKAYDVLDTARQQARETLEAARAQADEMYQVGQREFESITREIQMLNERRNTFHASLYGFLNSQLDALENLGAEPISLEKLQPQTEQPPVTTAGSDALADLDRELAAFADELIEAADEIAHESAHHEREATDAESDAAPSDESSLEFDMDDDAEVLVESPKRANES